MVGITRYGQMRPLRAKGVQHLPITFNWKRTCLADVYSGPSRSAHCASQPPMGLARDLYAIPRNDLFLPLCRPSRTSCRRPQSPSLGRECIRSAHNWTPHGSAAGPAEMRPSASPNRPDHARPGHRRRAALANRGVIVIGVIRRRWRLSFRLPRCQAAARSAGWSAESYRFCGCAIQQLA